VRPLIAVLAAAAALALSAAQASAAVSISSFTLAPASTQAGASTAVSVDAKFSSSDGDSVKDATLSLAPGLLANPTAPTRCQASDFQNNTCPSSSQIGDGTITATAPSFGTTLSLPVRIYLIAPQGSELARIGLIASFFDYPAASVSAPVQVRTSPSVGLNIPLTGIPNQVSGTSVTIDEIALRLFGTVNGQAFTRLPTSCGVAHTTLTVDSYGASSTPVTGDGAFTPTGCSALSYNPQLSASATLDSADDGVALDSTITQSASDAATGTATLAVPSVLSPRVSALGSACSAGDLSTCPPVGSATVTSPLLGSPLSGIVVLATNASSPTLDAVFPAPFALVFRGTPSFGTSGLQVSFTGIPDIPITRLEVRLGGGPNSLLSVGSGLCSQPQTVSGQFGAQSGATAIVSSTLAVNGCDGSAGSTATAPKLVRAWLRGVASGHPKLHLQVANAAYVTVSLPRGLRFSHRRGGQVVVKPAGEAPFAIALLDTTTLKRHKPIVIKLRLRSASGQTKTVSVRLRP
jgi:hypothetical protein